MDIFKKYIDFSYKLLKAHILIHFISHAFSALIYVYIFLYKNKYFVVTFITIQIVLLILILKMLCLIRTTHFSSFDQLKCGFNFYMMMSLVYFILIIIKFVLIFRIFKWKIIYKIILICVSLLYYIFDSFIFFYEYVTIHKQINKSISDRIIIQMEAQNRNAENNIVKNDTQQSEKTHKNETFEKEDTIYIICDKKSENKNNIISINKTNKKIINNFVVEAQINNSNNNNSFNKEMNKIKDKKNNNMINFIHYKLETIETSTKRKLSLSEENKSKNFERIKKILPISKKK